MDSCPDGHIEVNATDYRILGDVPGQRLAHWHPAPFARPGCRKRVIEKLAAKEAGFALLSHLGRMKWRKRLWPKLIQ
jgi:hypothetical protein